MKISKVKGEKKFYQNWWFWSILVFVLVVFGFVFKNDVKAMYLGVDVKYIDNPLYCEQDSDCKEGNKCGEVINIYNFKSVPLCHLATCGTKCENNNCVRNINCEEIWSQNE